MQKFEVLNGVAAPMNIVNIDTDMIIPKQFLKTIKRTGLGKSLFYEMRYTQEGQELPEFVLNKPAYRKAEILVAGDNFGCGSSREHAPWAIEDYGFRVIIAASFADIFFNNCYKNGMLPIVLPAAVVDSLFKATEADVGYKITIDLAAQTITTPDGEVHKFEIAPEEPVVVAAPAEQPAFEDLGELRAAERCASFFARARHYAPGRHRQSLPRVWRAHERVAPRAVGPTGGGDDRARRRRRAPRLPRARPSAPSTAPRRAAPRGRRSTASSSRPRSPGPHWLAADVAPSSCGATTSTSPGCRSRPAGRASPRR